MPGELWPYYKALRDTVSPYIAMGSLVKGMEAQGGGVV